LQKRCPQKKGVRFFPGKSGIVFQKTQRFLPMSFSGAICTLQRGKLPPCYPNEEEDILIIHKKQVGWPFGIKIAGVVEENAEELSAERESKEARFLWAITATICIS